MKILKLFLCLFALALITSYCTPQSLDDNQSNHIENTQSTGDDDASVSDGSKP